MDYNKAKRIAVDKLENELNSKLSYHNLAHTTYVCDAATKISEGENIKGDELTILQTAAIYHDIGFINYYQGHEKESARIAKNILPDCDYNQKQIDKICEIILATEMPQRASSLSEKIICDSDLYYLGDERFFFMGSALLQEWNELGIKKTIKEWYDLQYSFLTNHSYFTKTATEQRERQKQLHINEIIELLNINKP